MLLLFNTAAPFESLLPTLHSVELFDAADLIAPSLWYYFGEYQDMVGNFCNLILSLDEI